MKMLPNSKDLLSEKVRDSLRAFNEHARDCYRCEDPYAVHLSETRTLCDTGHGLAQTIADYLYSKARNSPTGQIEVTFPEGWESVDGLIRSITHQLQGQPSNWINYAAVNPPVATVAAPITTATAAREAGMYTYVTEDYYRGSSYVSDISRRVESGVRRSPSGGHRRHHVDPARSSNFNLSTQMLPSPPSSPSSSASSHHHHHHHHPHHSHHSHHSHHRSPRSSTSNTSSTRVVSFNPEVQTRYI